MENYKNNLNIGSRNAGRKNPGRVPKGTLILGEGQYYSKDGIKTHVNNNALVVGTAGSGKTRGFVIPNILQADGSYIISDPKGNLAKKYGPYLESKGYHVIVMDFIHPERSHRYNPITRCRDSQDVKRLAYMLVYELNADKNHGSAYDPFWDEASWILLMALIGYMAEADYMPESEKTFSKLAELIADTCMADGRKRITEKTGILMNRHREWMERHGRESWAYKRYKEFSCAPEKTHNTITITSLAKLVSFDSEELRVMLSGNDVDFKALGQERNAVFVEVSDTDRSMDVLINLFYSQAMNELCDYADNCCEGSRLPVPVQFILDDFATNARINNFERIISNIRSRGISTMIMLQSESQLTAVYGDNAQTIIDNCNTYAYLGGGGTEQAKVISQRADKPFSQILNMPLDKCWLFRRGQQPVLCDVFDLNSFEKELGVIYGQPVREMEYDRSDIM